MYIRLCGPGSGAWLIQNVCHRISKGLRECWLVSPRRPAGRLSGSGRVVSRRAAARDVERDASAADAADMELWFNQLGVVS